MDFHTKFLLYARQANIGKDIWSEDYFEKLKPSLQNALAATVHTLKTFEELYTTARITQNTLDRTAKITTRLNRNSSIGNPKSSSTTSKPRREQGTPAAENRSRSPLPDTDRQMLRTTGRCFKCRKQGHIASNCSEKEPTPAPKDISQTSVHKIEEYNQKPENE